MDQSISPVLKPLLILLGAFAAFSAGAEDLSYPAPDPYLGEALYNQEVESARNLGLLLQSEIRDQYVAGGARRDAHPKAHGCVEAEFRVNSSLPANLQHGVFQPGKRYPSIIRFSNGSPDATQADAKGDPRGMAIKLLEVPGKKLLDVQEQAFTQDFLLISSPYFFVQTPSAYYRFFQASSEGGILNTLRIPFYLGWQGTINGFRMLRTKIGNPLATRYWSAVPYQLGLEADRQSVKYSVKPCSISSNDPPENPGRNFLRSAMEKTLSEGDACMTFMVQVNRDNAFSVEDSVHEWGEAAAPFVSVATIAIPQQVFSTPEKNAQCEDRSFNPWHALPEHRPLGAINRMRKAIYFQISALRHAMNGKEVSEP